MGDGKAVWQRIFKGGAGEIAIGEKAGFEGLKGYLIGLSKSARGAK